MDTKNINLDCTGADRAPPQGKTSLGIVTEDAKSCQTPMAKPSRWWTLLCRAPLRCSSTKPNCWLPLDKQELVTKTGRDDRRTLWPAGTVYRFRQAILDERTVAAGTRLPLIRGLAVIHDLTQSA